MNFMGGQPLPTTLQPEHDLRMRKRPGSFSAVKLAPAAAAKSMYSLSHDILVPDSTVKLSPLAVSRRRGQMDGMVKSAVRALHTLELLTLVQRPLRAIEIARSLGMSPSSTNQLLGTMVDTAYLIFNQKHYYPSPRLMKLGISLGNNYFGFGNIDRLMQSVHRALGNNLSLSTCQAGYMQVIDSLILRERSAEAQAMPLDPHFGFRTPLFGSCIGAAWLSSQSEMSIRSAIRTCRRELGKRNVDNPRQIITAIQRVREQGHAYGGLSGDDCVRTVAIPLPPCPNGIVLVLAVSGPSSDIRKRRVEIVNLLKDNVRTHLELANPGENSGI
jgi:IclR family transcriptional regulator, pca regulon regulatory protein